VQPDKESPTFLIATIPANTEKVENQQLSLKSQAVRVITTCMMSVNVVQASTYSHNSLATQVKTLHFYQATVLHQLMPSHPGKCTAAHPYAAPFSLPTTAEDAAA